MADPTQLLARNRRWAKRVVGEESGYFRRLATQESPEFLWIGCSEARVPATQIVDLEPGQIFVHRNVANLVIHSDLSCLSAMQYAVDKLAVPHIIVCGHYGCTGIAAALSNERQGLVDNWLRPVRDTLELHRSWLDEVDSQDDKIRCLTELNVIAQVKNVAATTVVQDAWSRGQELAIHGWVYNVADALLHDLDVTLDLQANVRLVEKRALNRIMRGEAVETIEAKPVP